MSDDPIVGIDLGTTNTLVAVLEDAGPRVLPGPDGATLLPSAVAVDATGHLLVGAAAAARLARVPSAGARRFKQDMGSDRRFSVGPHTLSATELSALVLKEAKAWAEAALGVPVRRAVVTVPAYFAEPQRAATRAAAELAGLEVVRILNEPTAAALAYGVADAERERRICVVDLGGGTLDVTVLEGWDGVLEVTGTGGDGRLGGEDFTDRLWAWACAEAGLPAPGDAPSPEQALLREACEDAKRALATADFALLPLGSRTVPVTRRIFGGLVAQLVDRVSICVTDTLAVIRRTPRDIDEVVLAGGATRMAPVRERVAALFGKEPVEGVDPDHAVALGAALQAGLVGKHRAVRDVVVTDVVAHSLGIEIAKSGEDRLHPGYFLPVIHRNTTLPTRRIERVSTTHPRQTAVTVSVYEGEHRYVRENRLLGEFTIAELPPPKDPEHGTVAIDVAFTHDVNGLLEVEAAVVGHDRKGSIVIEKHAGRLDPAAREAAVAALARLKVYARDLLPNRLLLEEALTRHARLDPESRRLLDAVLFAFEDALAREHPEAIAAAALALRNALAHPRLAP